MTSVAPYNANDPYEQLIAQTIAIERQPQFALRGQRSDQSIFKGVLSDFDSTLSALSKALDKLTDQFTNPFAARAAKVPENAGFGVSVTDDAVPGSHTLTVERLATADTRAGRRLSAGGSELRGFFDTFGEQTFEVEVFSPTEVEPERRVPISVTVNATAATDDGILDQVRAAIDDAMSAAVSDGTIRAEDAASASVLNETTDTSRLTLRSGATGFESRLGFTDSADGFLGLLQLDRAAGADTAGDVTTAATAAGTNGSSLSAPLTIDASNDTFELNVGGIGRSVQLAAGTYDTPEALATALGDALGGDLDVQTVDGALRITTTATGSAASLQITGGTALGALGFAAMTEAATGADAQTRTISAEESGGQMTAVGTSETDSALNARFNLDGFTLYRGQNEVSDALEGMTISLSSVGDATAFSVDTDEQDVVASVKDFIKKYNDTLGFIARKSKVDPDAGTRGDFAGDTSIRGLRFGMRTDLLQPVAGQPEGIARLTEIGIEFNDDGTLKLADEDALSAAARRDPNAVQNLFADEENGLAMKLTQRLDAFLGTDGILSSRKKSVDARIDRLDDRIERWDTRLAKREDQLRQQYARFQETIALLQGQSDSLASFYYGSGF